MHPVRYAAAMVVVFAVLPFLLLHREGRRRYRPWDAGSYAVGAGLILLSRVLAIEIDLYVAAVAFAVVKLAMLMAFTAGLRREQVRWSAGPVAFAALLVYAALIPAMLRTPIDGDEPYYLLMTESLVKDRDLDLANQYRDLAHSATGRLDLVPQLGDLRGPNGEQYSRLEPFLPLLLVPGYAVAGLTGALFTMAVFGALLVRSVVRLFEEEGISDRTSRIVVPLIAFGPPVVFYAARIWPEVPAALLFVEAVRGVRRQRERKWIPALVGLALLKLRFVLVAAIVAARAVIGRRTSPRWAFGILLVVILSPMLIIWLVSGRATSVHTAAELAPGPFVDYWRGLFGLALDGADGMLLQAPILVLALAGLVRWRRMPEAFRLGCAASALYLLFLLPRPEWHGGWSPPLRYIVYFVPILGLGAAAMIDRIRASTVDALEGWLTLGVGAAALWTVILVVHGAAWPWRLFHIASGENFVGEWLSAATGADFSRLFPSFIRLNRAALVASLAMALILILYAAGLHRRVLSAVGPQAAVGIAALLLSWAIAAARLPADIVEFEDAHVVHTGGELFPEPYRVARFRYRGGWVLRAGDSVSFLWRPGPSRLRYSASQEARIAVNESVVTLPAARDGMVALAVPFARGRTLIRCLSGEAVLDRMDHD
jgi:hypothetical protein